MTGQTKFWETTALSAMTAAQWESLCDGCARCCLIKLQDEDTHEVFNTSVSCRLLDIETCRCKNYAQRQQQVPACTRVTIDNVDSLDWLPETCAYRRLANGQNLPDWHYLVCGDREAVHAAGVSVKWFATCEDYVHPEQLTDFVMTDDGI